MVKTSNVALMVLIAFVMGVVVGAAFWRKYKPVVNLPVISLQHDTIYLPDTVRRPVPPPLLTTKPVRYDTVLRKTTKSGDTTILQISPTDGTVTPVDTVGPDSTNEDSAEPRVSQNGDIVIPIVQRVYATPDYRAVISGYHPALDSMEVYRQNRVVTTTITKYKRTRWGVTGGVGVGYAADGRVVPVIGVTVGYVIWGK